MLCSAAIDQILAFSDNVAPAGADYASRRQRILYWLIEEATTTYYAREWTFRLKGSAAPHVVVAANGGSGLLPADFLSIGKLGAVYNETQNGAPMYPAVESEITDLLALSTKVANSAIFTVFGTDGAAPPRKQIWIPITAIAVTLRLWYHPKMPPLADSTANGGDDAKDVNLDQAIPEEYQQTVIMPGMRSRARRSKGDTRWQADKTERVEGLTEMIKNNRRMQGGGQQLPSFFGG